MVSWSFVDSAGKPFAFYRCSVPGFSGFLNRSTPVSCSLPEFGLSLCLSPPCARHCFHRKSCAFSTMCTLKAKRFRRKFALCKPDARSRITRLFRCIVSNRRASLDPGAETANALRLALWLRLAHRSMLRYTRSQTGMEAVAQFRGGPVRIGIIGAGRIGRVHCAALARMSNLAQVVVIADFIEQAAQAAAKEFRIPRAVKDWQEVVQSPEVDAVIICSPSDTHYEIIVAAARAGKQIFCEKPIDYDLERIDNALSEVKRAGVQMQIGFQRRFDANFRRVREAVASGEIGEPYSLHIISRDPAPPPLAYLKQSGGLFFDMMTHDFDMARFTMGSEIVEVVAAAGANLVDPQIGEQAGDIDTAIVTLRFANGAIGTIECCRKAAYGYDQRIEIHGSKGNVSTANNFPNNATLQDGASVRRDLPLNFFMDRYRDAYALEMETFVRCIMEGKAVPVTGEDGRMPVVLAYAARKSMKERRAVRIGEFMSKL
jgi:myo-inositol 2-dehydrogenase/D-chiro-inositol 1-dehydrogenase